jgi:hypothetical protein
MEINTLADTGISHADTQDEVSWDDPRLKRIIRIRLLSDPDFLRLWGVWDVSYVLGQLKDGTQVRVRVPFYQLGRKYLSEMTQYARKEGVYLKGLCGGDLANVVSTSC